MNIFESTFEKHKQLMMEAQKFTSREKVDGDKFNKSIPGLTNQEVKNYKIKFGQMMKKDLGSFVRELQSAIGDSKVQRFLVAAQSDGTKDDDDVDIGEQVIQVSNLIPTQNEVFLEKSLDFPLNKQQDNIVSYIKNGYGKMPRIVVSGNYIIDGHHRWSQIYCLNAEAVIPVYNVTFSGKENPDEILKKMHLAISATTGTVPLSPGESKDTDLFKVDETTFSAWIHKNVDKNEYALEAFKTVEDDMKQKISSSSSGDEKVPTNEADGVELVTNVVIPYLWKNILQLKQQPGKYPRSIMPQTEKDSDINKFVGNLKSGNINVDPMTETLFESTFNKFKNLYTK